MYSMRASAGRRRAAAALIVCSVSLAGFAMRTDADNLLAADTFSEWDSRSFAGDTDYRLVTAPDGGTHIAAASQGTASARYLKRQVDLRETPWLEWRWRVRQPVAPANEQAKSGDDFAARVYVVYAPSLWPGSIRSLNYVWTHREAAGTSWPNPFTAKARMIALQQGATANDGAVWRQEKRNIREDLRRFFDIDATHIHGVAIMTDTDNTGAMAAADYADMRFSASP